MKICIKSILFFIINILCAHVAMATHIVGGTIGYDCLGYNAQTQTMTIRIRMYVYRDAINGQAAFDNPAYVGIFVGQNATTPYQTVALSSPSIQTLPTALNNLCAALPPNVRTEEAVYTETITLPYNSAGYTLSYQRCCRNNTINNLTNPQNVGATYSIYLSPQAMTSCNSSPTFSSFPPVAICRGLPLVYDHSATDANGNRLEYSFCYSLDGADPTAPAPNPPSGPPYANVPFRSPYSFSNPMPANPAMNIDATTGLLTGTPTQNGQYVVGVCVTEFDANGNILSRTLRDFQFNVAFCEVGVTAYIQADSVSPDSNRFFFRRCGSTSVVFNNLSRPTTIINGYNWQFSNGVTSTVTNPTINFGNYGNYTGKLVVNPNTPACSDSIQIFVELNPNPVASFNIVIDSCNPAQPPIQINNTSSISVPFITGYSWIFGDGTTGTNAQPSFTHQYPPGGTYTINLTATSSKGCVSTTSRTIQYYTPPVASFTISDSAGCVVPHTVTFTNTSTPQGTGYTYTWNLGNGVTATTTNATTTYTAPNRYNVVLTARNAWGCTSTVTHPVTVFPAPVAAFSFVRDSCQVDTVDFRDLSTGNNTSIVGWNWLFGDGSSSTQQNPQHLYTSANIFNVQLIATDAHGCRDTAAAVVRYYPAPTINIQNPTVGCAPFAVTFNNTSSPINGYTHNWTFGNGSTSTLVSPSTIYTTPNTYPVRLVISSPIGCTTTHLDTIRVKASPNASFTTAYDSCRILPVSFNETSTPNATGDALVRWQWLWGDSQTTLAQDTSHLYTQAGTYNVQLVVTDATGCTDTALRVLNWYPRPVVAIAANDSILCQFESVTFANNSQPLTAAYQLTWNFGDGTTSNAISPTHQYTQFGVFPVTLDIVSPIGCRANFRDTITVYQIPNANFSHRYDSCAFTGVRLTNTSTTNAAGTALTNWNWSFGDGGTAGNVNDTLYPYVPRDTYLVQLFVVDAHGCRDTAAYLLPYYPAPVFPVASHSQRGCVPQSVVFNNNALNNYTGYTFIWNMGNGVTTNTFETTYAYTNRGIYYPTLTVRTPAGCVETFRDTVLAFGIPQATGSASFDACAITPVTFRNRSAASPDASITSILWNFGDGTTGTQPLEYHTYTFPDTARYTINLRVTDGNNCQDDTTFFVDWFPKPIYPVALANSQGCVPLLAATPANNPYPVPYYTTRWTYGDGVQTTAGNPSDYYYTNAGEYTRQLIVVAPNGCTDTFSSKHTALAVPTAAFIYNPTVLNSFNPTVQFTDQSIDAAGWEWHLGLNRLNDVSYQQNPLYTYRDTGVFNVMLVAKHRNGCTDTALQKLDIVPQFTYFLPNAFTPNMDGTNDGFRGNGITTYISKFDMQIFNRWGELIFETNDPTEAWNGRKNNSGNLCQAGVYVVVVNLVGARGEKQRIEGFATLIY